MTADEIVAGVLAQPTATFSPAVRTLVAEIVRLRGELEKMETCTPKGPTDVAI